MPAKNFNLFFINGLQIHRSSFIIPHFFKDVVFMKIVLRIRKKAYKSTFHFIHKINVIQDKNLHYLDFWKIILLFKYNLDFSYHNNVVLLPFRKYFFLL